MTEESTRAAALRAGEIDITYLLTGPIAEETKRTPGLRLVAPLLSGGFWLDLPEQWDPKSPWHDRRVRLAASHAIDRKAVNQAETLGFSRLTDSIVPRVFQYALPLDPPPYDPAKAKQLLAEAGYPNGFDAGDLTPFPPYFSMGEAVGGVSPSRGHQDPYPDHGARGLSQRLARQEAPRHRADDHRGLRERGDAARAVRDEERNLRVRLPPRAGRPLCAPGPRDPTRRNARRCSSRSSRAFTTTSSTCRSTSWPSSGAWARASRSRAPRSSRIRLLGPLRGPPAQEVVPGSRVPSYSLGIDIGGTFTDIVVYDHDSGRQWSRKVLTTHDDPARAVAAGVAALLREGRLRAAALHQGRARHHPLHQRADRAEGRGHRADHDRRVRRHARDRPRAEVRAVRPRHREARAARAAQSPPRSGRADAADGQRAAPARPGGGGDARAGAGRMPASPPSPSCSCTPTPTPSTRPWPRASSASGTRTSP